MRISKIITTAVFSVLVCSICRAQLPIYDMAKLDEAREAYKRGESGICSIIESLREQADGFIGLDDLSVTDKTMLPPSGDPRDYMSQAPYWWPDPDSPDGLPYIRHDGKTNPEIYNYPDLQYRATLSSRTQILGILYYFTGERKYAEKCASLIRTWFIDPVKGMNPNMNFAEAIIGRNTGRDAGTIQANPMLRSFAGLYLIKDSGAWSEKDAKELKEWAWAFWYWLTHSKNGIAEGGAPNNHAMQYEATKVYAMSLFATPEEIIASVKNSMLPRLATQIAEDGTLPQELARTKSLSYCCTALIPLIHVNSMCANLGYSLWDYTAENGRRLEMALDYLVPYYCHPETWPHEQITPYNINDGIIILYNAGIYNGKDEWVRKAAEIGYKRDKADVNSVLNYRIADVMVKHPIEQHFPLRSNSAELPGE